MEKKMEHETETTEYIVWGYIGIIIVILIFLKRRGFGLRV